MITDNSNYDINYLKHKKDDISSNPLSDRFKLNQSISSYLEKSSLIFKMTYITKKENPIKLFNNKFLNKYKRRCKMIINNKLCDLTDNYKISKGYKKIIKMKLLIFKGKEINLSKMFYECKSLKKFSVLSKDEFKNKKISKEEPINSKLDNVNTSEYDSLDEQLSNKLSFLNKTINKSKQTDKNKKIFIFSSDINKPHFTFILSSNKNIAGDNKSQMN